MPWQNYGLRTKINLIMLLILAVFLAVSLFWQYRQQRAFVFAEAVDKARIITAEATRTREYNSQQLLIGRVELTRDRYGMIPVVSANRIGQLVARDLGYTIRHTSLRYRNANNAPDAYERAVLKRLEDAPDLQYVAEISTLDGAPVFRYLQAARIDESCLTCHGDPAQSPAFLREIYPPDKDASYHYRVGEVIGAVSVVIPMTQLERQMSARFRSTVVTTGGFFLALSVCLGLLVRTSVVRPIAALATTLGRIARTGRFSERLPVMSGDEIGRLVGSFNEMMEELGKKTAELEESEKRFRLVTEMARDAIVAFLPGGQIFMLNRQGEELFGYSRGDLLGESVDRLFAEDPVFGASLTAFLAKAEADWFRDVHPVTGLHRDRTPVSLEMLLIVVDTGERPFYTAMLRRTEQDSG